MPKPPIILKHEFMKKLERLAERPEKVRGMLERLRNHDAAQALADRLVANEICSQEAADRMVQGWGDDSNMETVWAQFGQAADWIDRDRDLKLDMWWVQADETEFDISVELRGRKVRVMLWTEHVPRRSVMAKRAYDPAYLEELRTLRIYLDEILSEAEAAQH